MGRMKAVDQSIDHFTCHEGQISRALLFEYIEGEGPVLPCVAYVELVLRRDLFPLKPSGRKDVLGAFVKFEP